MASQNTIQYLIRFFSFYAYPHIYIICAQIARTRNHVLIACTYKHNVIIVITELWYIILYISSGFIGEGFMMSGPLQNPVLYY